MKRLTTLLLITFIILFSVTTLYLFEIPPFTAKQNTSDTKTTPTTANPPKSNLTFKQHLSKGDTFLKNNLKDLAIKEYQSANAINPESITPLIKIGRVHFQDNDFEKALKNFQAAITIQPQNIEAKLNLGRTYIAQRKTKEAKETFNSITAENQLAKYYQGLISILDGNHDQAKEKFQQAITIATSKKTSQKAKTFLAGYKEFESYRASTNAHRNTILARAMTKAEEYQMAITLLFQVIKEKSDYRDSWLILGYSYLQTSQYTEALEALEEAKKLDSQKPETLFFLGLTHLHMNQLDKAANNLEAALENGFEPKIQIEQKLAEIYTLLKQYDEAAANFEKVIAKDDSKINFFVQPIWIYLTQLQDIKAAQVLAQKAQEAHPQEAMSYNLLGWVNIESDNLLEAKKNILLSLKLNPRFDAAHLNLGRIYTKEGSFTKAKKSFQTAYELGRGNSISLAAQDEYNLVVQAENNKSIQVNILQE